jgi:hypothetical protein
VIGIAGPTLQHWREQGPSGELAGALPWGAECSGQHERASLTAARGLASQMPPIKRQGDAGSAAIAAHSQINDGDEPLI